MKTCNILRPLALLCLMLNVMSAYSQNKYRWTDELALLRSIDRLPEYRSGCLIEQFSSYDPHGATTTDFPENTPICARKTATS